MDNVCHTLVGAAFGEAGLKRQTRFGLATLMIAANLPDIDVAVFATDVPSVAFRRGWTHGVLAQALLPLLLSGIVWWFGRRQRSAPDEPPLRPGWLVVLAYAGVLSHVGLDWLNNYGVRLLMPFSSRWFYGDTLFIVDPWMWAMLGAGVWLSRRSGAPRAARRALVAATLYVVMMLVGARAAHSVVNAAWVEAHGVAPRALMVGPRAITPLSRDIIVDAGDHYETGRFSWLPTRIQFDSVAVPNNADRESVARARVDPAIAAFLVWSRFPAWELHDEGHGIRVTVSDMRFGAVRRVLGGARFEAGTTIPVVPSR